MLYRLSTFFNCYFYVSIHLTPTKRMDKMYSVYMRTINAHTQLNIKENYKNMYSLSKLMLFSIAVDTINAK
jgi:hypothetical protein